jgi:dTDP-glucose 4,6-dehydratase
VHTSTSEVYGTAQRVPIDEDHPLNAQSPYAASKIGADQLALSYVRSFELSVVVARPFNTYGPRQSARAVIPTIVAQALSGADRLEIGSLDPTRDFVFVEDTVRGLIACAEAKDVDGEVVNLGSGVEITIGELVERIKRLVGVELPVHTSDDRLRPPASEVERLLADAGKAKRLLGWTASTTLDEGLARVVDWMRGSLGVYKPSRYNV